MEPQGHASPQVVAHRGASAAEPEHTRAAYRHALEVGADALECDVRLTADGHLVCVHDRTVNRTSDGDGCVSSSSLSDLRRLDWGSWRPVEPTAHPGSVRTHERSQLITLRELFELVRDCDRPVQVAVETKHPTRHGPAVEKALAEMLREFGWHGPGGPVRMMSFSAPAVRRMHRLTPGLPLVQLMDHLPRLRCLGLGGLGGSGFGQAALGAPGRGVGTVGLGVEMLRERPDQVAALRERGFAVHVWTVDEEADVDRCLALGVEAIITNRPADVLRHLGRA